MKITVTNVSQSIFDLLTQEQLAQVAENRNTKIPYDIFIQNLQADVDIYIEAGFDATVTDGMKIAKNGGTFEIDGEMVLDDIKLIADGASNDDVRLLINN